MKKYFISILILLCLSSSVHARIFHGRALEVGSVTTTEILDGTINYIDCDNTIVTNNYVAQDIEITPPAITNSTADDYTLKITQDLNDGAGSGTFRGVIFNLLTTNVVGWSSLYLHDWQVDGSTKASVRYTDTTDRVNMVIGPASGGTVMSFLEGANNAAAFRTDYANDAFVWYLDDDVGRQIVIGNLNSFADYGHGVQTNPALFIHSAISPVVDDTQYVGLYHDQTNGHLDVGKGALDLDCGRIDKITTVSVPTYNIAVDDYILHVTYTDTGACTLNLTTATAGQTGRRYYIKDAGGNAIVNNIVIDTEGAETIDGIATYTISADYDSLSVYSDGTNWFIY